MSVFGIQFLPEAQTSFPSVDGHRYGQLRIGDHVETFLAPMSYWGELEYRRQWRTGLQRLSNGAASTCLVTSITDPKQSNFVRWWALYRDGDMVILQEHIHFLDESPFFDAQNPYASVTPHVRTSDDGSTISEWSVKAANVFAAVDDIHL